MSPDMNSFEFEPTATSRSAEAAMRTIDALSVSFPSADEANVVPDLSQAPFLYLYALLGHHLIPVTPQMAVQGLIDTGFSRQEIVVALREAIQGPRLTAETERINRWLRAGGRDSICEVDVKRLIAQAGPHLVSPEAVVAAIIGAAIAGVVQPLVVFAASSYN